MLTGADGYDYLAGGSGNDRFNFDENWGDDTIADFANNGLEKINFAAHAGINNIGDLTISNGVGGALIAFRSDSIQVLGVTAAQLDSSDFIF